MNWDAVGAIGEILGAVAVLATLIYLAIQVSQAKKLQQAEAIRATRQERRELFAGIRDSPYVPELLEKLEYGNELSRAEKSRIDAHYAVCFGVLFSSWAQDRLGLTGEYTSRQDANFKFVLSQPGARDWIDEFGKSLYPEEFIDELLSAGDT